MVRLAGLYSVQRGPHSVWLNEKRVSGAGRPFLSHTVPHNIVPYRTAPHRTVPSGPMRSCFLLYDACEVPGMLIVLALNEKRVSTGASSPVSPMCPCFIV